RMTDIIEEEPYVAIVYNDYLDSVCSSCFREDTPLKIRNGQQSPPKACKGCKKVYYCGADCQKNDWKIHKVECKFLSAASVVPPYHVRMIARLLIRRKRGDHSTLTAWNGRKLEDLMDHLSDFNNRLDILFDATKDYVSSEYMVDREEILGYGGKMMTNQFAIVGANDQYIGNGLYIGCSAFDHSCQPDLTRRSIGSKMVLRSQNREQTLDGIDKLKVTYTSPLNCTEERRKSLSSSYFFHCECRMCEDKDKDGYARSIKCESCEDGICLVKDDSTFLLCLKCGTTNSITVEEAHKWNAHLVSVDDSGNGDVYFLTQCYDDMTSKLSRRNINLANLAFRLCTAFYTSKAMRSIPLAAKYAEACEEALMSMTTVGLPDRTSALEILAQVAFEHEQVSPNSRRLLGMWREAVLASNGTEDAAREKGDEATLEMYANIKDVEKYFESVDDDDYDIDEERRKLEELIRQMTVPEP
ncbi:hypothetical protein PENTCL1PPCAC_23567, partial [Pristionchus entomophagus]